MFCFGVQIKNCYLLSFQAKDIRGGSLDFKIHYWLGENTTQVRKIETRKTFERITMCIKSNGTWKHYQVSAQKPCLILFWVLLCAFEIVLLWASCFNKASSPCFHGDERDLLLLDGLSIKSVEQHRSLKKIGNNVGNVCY